MNGESLLKAPLISNYKLKRIFCLKRTAKFNINSKSTTRLICNSYLEISIARDLGGLAFISAIKTSRPFKLNIIFHPAWKSEWESRYEFIKNTISTQKSNDIAEKTNSLLFRWLETWIHLWHLLCDSLHTIQQFYVAFSTSYHAIRTVVWKVHSLIEVPSGLRRAESCVLCVRILWKILHHCWPTRKTADGQWWCREKQQLFVPPKKNRHKAVYCAWTQNSVRS